MKLMDISLVSNEEYENQIYVNPDYQRNMSYNQVRMICESMNLSLLTFEDNTAEMIISKLIAREIEAEWPYQDFPAVLFYELKVRPGENRRVSF